ncbi:hypothetical protein GCM10022386_12220 [Flavobacterium cheonhonense]|jgi:glycosyltransferase involved in cell wall biosynthesis|uniref:Glycosyltransferase 2-like domain-containing protein n=1 Tax=Flavobacterium cheonhonense TaxID=706185 RepID=A0ABP7TQW8_9FLAO|nr:glycosyltransferase family A protein [Flavobacterium cheonhonense]
MNHPLISIIIPTYNREHALPKTISSIISQTYFNWECIIVDDGSTDGTAILCSDWIENDSRIQFIKRGIPPKGASHCRNIGLAAAKGDYVIFLDSDDILLPHCLEQRQRLLFDIPGKKFYVFSMYVERSHERFLKVIPSSQSYLEDFLRYKIHWGIMCVFWERAFVTTLGGFHINYPRLNDPELCIRAMLTAGDDFCIANEHQYPPDSVYIQGEVKDKVLFSEKYKEALQLFIPDMLQALEKHNQLHLQNNLIAYLRLWVNHFAKFADAEANAAIFDLFLKNRLIGKKIYFQLKFYIVLLSINGTLAGKFRKLIFNQFPI